MVIECPLLPNLTQARQAAASAIDRVYNALSTTPPSVRSILPTLRMAVAGRGINFLSPWSFEILIETRNTFDSTIDCASQKPANLQEGLETLDQFAQDTFRADPADRCANDLVACEFLIRPSRFFNPQP
jgi:hypothetical protein